MRNRVKGKLFFASAEKKFQKSKARAQSLSYPSVISFCGSDTPWHTPY
jgi:hypothetical protein